MHHMTGTALVEPPRERNKYMKKIIGLAMVGAMSLGALAACGSDSKSTAKTVAPVATSGDTVSGGGGGGTSGAVDQFCSDAKALGEKVKAAIADPTKLAALQADVTKFTTDAAALTSANPNDADKISACVKEMTDAMTGG